LFGRDDRFLRFLSTQQNTFFSVFPSTHLSVCLPVLLSNHARISHIILCLYILFVCCFMYVFASVNLTVLKYVCISVDFQSFYMCLCRVVCLFLCNAHLKSQCGRWVTILIFFQLVL
jgi:hypothetical protein